MKPLADDVIGVIERAKKVGVEKIITIGTDVKSSKNALLLAKKYPQIYATVGAHVETAKNMDLSTYQQLIALARDPQVVAIGEIGLDYYLLDKSSRYANIGTKPEQVRLFEQMIDIAIENQLPIIVHSRDSASDTLSIINSYKSELVGGVFHCFSYSLEESRKFLDTRFFLSFTNIIGYKKNEDLREVVKFTPIEKILIETDAPFLPPEERRGQVSEPTDVFSVAKIISEVKKIELKEVEKQTTQNAKTLFDF